MVDQESENKARCEIIQESENKIISHLARMEERVQSIQDNLALFRTELKDSSAESREKIDAIRKEFFEHEKKFVTEIEFEPVKKLVYGTVGFLLLSLGGMIVSLLTKGH